MSAFHHELFHNLQRNIKLNEGGSGDASGENDDWLFFTEGTAVLASSIGQSAAEFAQIAAGRAYMSYSNEFLAGGGYRGNLNKSYRKLSPYRSGIYWRFLYEQCGGMRGGAEEPAAGMQVIGRMLTALYSQDIVDTNPSDGLIGKVPGVMDAALDGSSCPFQTHAESLVAFTRAIYGLRLEGGRCTGPGTPSECGFYDPNNLYRDPPVSTLTYSGAEVQHSDGINGSFGMDFIDVVLDPSADGQRLTIEFSGAEDGDADFTVQLWELLDPDTGGKPRRVPTRPAAPETFTNSGLGGQLSHTIPAIDTTQRNRLGLIITRVDAEEDSDSIGEYNIRLHPGAERDGWS